MNSIAEILKNATRGAHVQTEKILLRQLKELKTTDEYLHILSVFYGYFHPLELEIDKYVTENILPDISLRKRSSRIIADLRWLQYFETPSIADKLPPVANYQQAVGVMYVLEGSTLGGQHIAKMLSAKPALRDHGKALSFFKGYEDHNLEMWQRFLHHLEANIKEKDVETVVQSATQTFSLLEKWILNGTNEGK